MMSEIMNEETGNSRKCKNTRISLESKDFDDGSLSVYSKKVESNYLDFVENKNIGDDSDIIRCLKRIIFGKGQLDNCDTLEVLIPTFKMLIENVCGLSIAEYDSLYGVNTNKQIHAENISRKITGQASDETKEECAFDRKNILFKMVWPEYYKNNFTKVTYSEIYSAKCELKAGLMRAAKPIDEDEVGVKKSDGQIVDRIIFNTIVSTFTGAGFDTYYKIMEALIDDKRLDSIGKRNTPGILSVIKERKCYANALDFFFLNMPREDQMCLVDDFMDLRERGGYPHQQVMDIMYETFKNNEEAFFNTLESF